MPLVRHRLPVTHWPSAAEAENSLLFSPLPLGRSCVLATRTWVPAMVPWRASESGECTDAVVAWYGRFAEGRPGAIVVEATGIRNDIPSGPLLRIGHDRFVDGLRRLVEEVRVKSRGNTRLFLQVIDFLGIKRRPSREKYFSRFLVLRADHRQRLCALLKNDHFLGAPETEVRAQLSSLGDIELEAILSSRELEDLRRGARERVTDTHASHIRDLPRVLPRSFADAALRAERAGFDGVELHYAHAYTMASFLSRKNDRSDGYGGSREARVRLPLEIISAVRAVLSPNTVLGCRFLSDEVIEGGSRIDDAIYYGQEFARAGVDFLSLSTGGKFEDAKDPRVGEAIYPYTGLSGRECMPTVLSDDRGPFGRHLGLARQVRASVREIGLDTPIVAAGGINSFTLAEAALARGDADIIGAARQTLADPDWFWKVRLGHGDDVRRCEYTNYCEGLDQRHKQVTCKLWDRVRTDDEIGGKTEVALTTDGKRRLTAPGWPRRPPG